jgi:hypothetical protein
MSSLGDVLELVFARPDRAASVHAVLHEQCDREVAQRVGEQFMKDQPTLRSAPKIVWLMAAPAVAVATGKSLVERFPTPALRTGARARVGAHHLARRLWPYPP